jgi:uncharacterized protein YoxC
LKPTLEELQYSLKSARTVTDNINVVTEDVKTLSSSVREIGQNVKRVSDIVGNVTVHASGLKAGIMAAFEVMVKHFISKDKKTQ